MDADRALDSAKKVFMVIDALKADKLKVRPQDEALVSELMALPIGPTGLPNLAELSTDAVAFARALGPGLMYMQQGNGEDKKPVDALPLADAQCKLFHLFEELFVALTGAASNQVNSPAEIKSG